jgi:ABC-2 type transport system permease protein
MLKGVTFITIWKETAMLIGMTLFFMLVSIKKYKIRLE